MGEKVGKKDRGERCVEQKLILNIRGIQRSSNRTPPLEQQGNRSPKNREHAANLHDSRCRPRWASCTKMKKNQRGRPTSNKKLSRMAGRGGLPRRPGPSNRASRQQIYCTFFTRAMCISSPSPHIFLIPIQHMHISDHTHLFSVSFPRTSLSWHCCV